MHCKKLVSILLILLVSLTANAQDLIFKSSFEDVIVSYPDPVIDGFTPDSAPTGTLVTLTGDHFSPAPGVAPGVTVNRMGGGLMSAPIASFSDQRIEFIYPAGATSGVIRVTVNGVTVSSAQAFTTTPSSTFALHAATGSADVIRGQSVSYALHISSQDRFDRTVDLAVTDLPPGIGSAFSPASIAQGQTALLELTASGDQALGEFVFEVVASAEVEGILTTDTVSLGLVVNPVSTSFMGRTVVDDPLETTLAGVTVSFIGRDDLGNATGCFAQTVSDASGNFALTDLPVECTGGQLIRYDGSTVTDPPGKYAGVDLYYLITQGAVTVSPVLVHLPRIDNQETVMVQQNAPHDQVFSFSTVPGLEAIVYSGTTLTLIDGTQPDPFPLTAIQVAVDRLPEEMPPEEVFPSFIVAFQPANATASQPVAVTFPNALNVAPATSLELSTLDPTLGRMVVYGTGTVSDNGRQVIPDFDPAFPGHRYGLVHFDWHGPVVAPNPERNPASPGSAIEGEPDLDDKNGCGSCPSSSNPIDYATGLEVITETDMVLGSGRGEVAIERVYRTLSVEAGPFGLGSNHRYGYSLDNFRPQFSDMVNLVLPDGNRVPLARGDDDLFTNTAAPMMQGVRMQVDNGTGVSELRWKNGTIYRFTPSTQPLGSLLTEIIDANGNRIQLRRDDGSPQQITEIVDPVGRKLLLTYDTANRITSVTDPIGREVSYTYNEQGTLETVTDPGGGVTRYGYDAQNRLVRETNPRSIVVFENVYDTNDRVVQQTLADGAVWQFDYTLQAPNLPDSPVLQTIVTDPLGNATTYRFSPQGYVMNVTDPGGQTRVFERDPGNNLMLSINGHGTCNVCGNPAAGETYFFYDDRGNLIERTDAQGNTTTFTHEPVFNKLTSITGPQNNTASFQYDASGNLVRLTDAQNRSTAIAYDEHGLLIQATNPRGETLSIAYDGFANPVQLTDARGNVTLRQFDALSRLVLVKNGLNQSSRFEYDPLNRLIATTDAMGQTTHFDYDEASNLLAVTDARNHAVSYDYDDRDRMVQRTDSLDNSEHYAYDLSGNLALFTDRRGVVSEFEYDALNRVTREIYPDGETVAYRYNPAGLPLEIIDSSGGAFYFAFDSLGRLIRSSNPVGVIDYDYDSRGLQTRRQVTGQAGVDYQYDSLANLTRIDHGAHAIDLGYDEVNRLLRQSRSNGVVSDYAYDPMGNLLTLVHHNGGTPLSEQAYSYDPLGKRSGHRSDTAQALTTPPELNEIDPLSNRLLKRNSISYVHDKTAIESPLLVRLERPSIPGTRAIA